MRRGAGMSTAAFVLAALAGCAEPPPPEFVSQAHKFKARFGREPKEVGNVGRTKSTVYSAEAPTGVLRVSITELPIPDDDPPERVPLYLKQAQDDLVLAARGTVTSGNTTTLAGKHPGREFAAKFGGDEPGAMRARIYLVGKRLYQVIAVGTEGFANAPAATAFLESFMVTE